MPLFQAELGKCCYVTLMCTENESLYLLWWLSVTLGASDLISTLAATAKPCCYVYLHLVILVPIFKGHLPQHLQISVWQYLCAEFGDVLQSSCELS